MTEDSTNIRVTSLEKRVAKLERQMEETQHDNKTFTSSLVALQKSIEGLTSSLSDVKNIREKLFQLELKLESVNQLRALMLGIWLTVIPASLTVVGELLVKFLPNSPIR